MTLVPAYSGYLCHEYESQLAARGLEVRGGSMQDFMRWSDPLPPFCGAISGGTGMNPACHKEAPTSLVHASIQG